MTPLHPTKAFVSIGLLLAAGWLIALSACGGASSAAANNATGQPLVAISGAPTSVAVGKTGTVTATVQNSSSDVTWTCTPTNACGSFNPTTTNSGQSSTYTAPSSVPTGSVVTVQAALTSSSSVSATAQVKITTSQTADFYVGGANASDSNPGTASQPFATIGRAQNAVQGLVQNSSGRTNPILVWIHQGTYFVPQGLTFGNGDSGTSSLEIIWQNYPGDQSPVVDGGMHVTGWTQNGNIWSTTLPAGTQYFEQVFYNGGRRLRARLDPSGDGVVGSYLRVANTAFTTSANANCPNSVTGGFECFDRFQYTAGDPISNNWTNLNGTFSGNTETATPCSATSNPYPVGDIALYSFEQMGMSKMLINCVDTTNHIIYLTGPIRIDNTFSGFITGHRYLVENVKDVFTQPGQWFLDRSAGSTAPMTLSYIPNSGENPSTDTIIIPQAPQVLVANNLRYVTFSGITFQHDNFTAWNSSLSGYAYNRLDQAITSAVSCNNCQNVTFDTDIITQTAGTGIDFTTTNQNATTTGNIIQNSAIYDIAAHGIRIGLLAQNSDTAANLPQFTTVQNNIISGFGRTFAKGFGIAQGCNHDNLYTQNEIEFGYSGGINIGALNCPQQGSSLTSNNVASFNLVHDIGQGVTNDFGCVYFNTSPQNTMPPSGNKALNNVCHDISDDSSIDSDGYGGQGIYIDNYTGLIDVENNLVFRASGSTVAQTCGPGVPGAANIIKNNVLAFSRGSMKQQGCVPLATNIQMFNMTNNLIMYDKGTIQGGCYSCMGGSCSTVLPATVTLDHNLYCYTPSGNSCTVQSNQGYAFFSSEDPRNQMGNCGRSPTYPTLTAWQAVGEDLNSAQGSAFANVGNSTATLSDYQSPDSNVASSVQFDSSNYTPQQAGRSNPVITVPAIADTFKINPFQKGQF